MKTRFNNKDNLEIKQPDQEMIRQLYFSITLVNQFGLMTF